MRAMVSERTELQGTTAATSRVVQLSSVPDRLRSATCISPQPIVPPELASVTRAAESEEGATGESPGVAAAS